MHWIGSTVRFEVKLLFHVSRHEIIRILLQTKTKILPKALAIYLVKMMKIGAHL